MALSTIKSMFLANLLLSRALAATTYKHVVAISVDGLHGSDIEKYLAVRPNSTLATLLETGYEYTNAYTSEVRSYQPCSTTT